MLGITTSDAIALGSMIAALTAVCVGLVKGNPARVDQNPERGAAPLPAASPNPEDLAELVAVLRELVDVLRAGITLETARHPLPETMHEFIRRLDRRPS